MALEIVGAGFGRTGTLSLKYALEKIGFGPCYHMAELQAHPEHASMWAQAHRGEPVDWDVLFEDYRATVDWPSCNLWKEQAEYYPDAKVILSTRDPERWYESVHNTIYASTVMARESDDPGIRARGEWAFEIIWDKIFHGRMDDKAHVIDVFRAHEERVKAGLAAVVRIPWCRCARRPLPEGQHHRRLQRANKDGAEIRQGTCRQVLKWRSGGQDSLGIPRPRPGVGCSADPDHDAAQRFGMHE
jgi:hypothetical protein